MAPVIDRLNQRLASFALQARGLGLMFLMPKQPDVLCAGSIMFGLSVDNVMMLPALIVQREFAARLEGRVDQVGRRRLPPPTGQAPKIRHLVAQPNIAKRRQNRLFHVSAD